MESFDALSGKLDVLFVQYEGEGSKQIDLEANDLEANEKSIKTCDMRQLRKITLRCRLEIMTFQDETFREKSVKTGIIARLKAQTN